jgi:glyoxylase-like metal-dependent hydrolase (beta-lactamase superfamily II)
MKSLVSLFLIAGMFFFSPLQAQKTLQQPGYYRMMVGDFEVTALCDGTIPQDWEKLLTNTTAAEIDSLRRLAYLSGPVETSVNAYLINTGSKLIMVDAGTAELFGPTLGHLEASIKAAGYTPAQIDVILATHIHTDHTGGLMEGDRMVFPNALIYASEKEADFWFNKANQAKLPKWMEKFFHEAEMKVGPYKKAGKLRTFGYGKELFPGITPLPAPGHTPGHTFYALESKGQKLVFWGDIMHAAAIQFPDPSVTIEYDVDPAAAAAQRKKAYAEAAREGYFVAAAHISFPGIGHLRASGTGYKWIPINYSTYVTP